MTATKKRPGRPRKYADNRVKTMLWRAKQESKRVDLYLNAKAAWRLDKLAKEWECSRAGVVERLLVEADEKYRDFLFPDQDGEVEND